MESDTAPPKPIRSSLLAVLITLVIVGLLAAIATPNFVGGGPSKTSGIINMLRQIDATKEEWAIEHGYTNNMPPSREITLQDIKPFFYHENGQDPFVRLHLVIDEDRNLLNPQGVVFVINPLGVSPKAKFTKAFKLNDHGGFFSPKIPKGTIMRFEADEADVTVILPGQESKPYKSLNDFLSSLD